MVITQEAIQARFSELEAQAKELKAHLHAVEGAMQDCEYFAEMLMTEEEALPAVEGFPEGVEVTGVTYNNPEN